MLAVRVLEDSKENNELWSRFIDQHPGSSLDHCWEWRWVLTQAFGYRPYYLGAFDAEQLVGVLPLFHVSLGFGKSALVSIPFGNYGGVCADSPQAASALIGESARLIEQLDCSYAAFYNRKPVEFEGLVPRDDKARYSLSLENASLEGIFAGLASTVRKKIRYAIKHGLTVQVSQDAGPLYEIHLRKFRQLGTPCFPKAYFDLILEHFGRRALIYYTCFEGKPIAFKFCVVHRDALTMIVGGDLEEYLHLQPNYLMFWRALEDAKAKGCSEIDLGRSSRDSGPAKHKLFLGMNESPLGYQYLVSGKHKFSLRTTGSYKFQLASRLWQKVPLSATRWIGPKLVRYFA